MNEDQKPETPPPAPDPVPPRDTRPRRSRYGRQHNPGRDRNAAVRAQVLARTRRWP